MSTTYNPGQIHVQSPVDVTRICKVNYAFDRHLPKWYIDEQYDIASRKLLAEVYKQIPYDVPIWPTAKVEERQYGSMTIVKLSIATQPYYAKR